LPLAKKKALAVGTPKAAEGFREPPGVLLPGGAFQVCTRKRRSGINICWVSRSLNSASACSRRWRGGVRNPQTAPAQGTPVPRPPTLQASSAAIWGAVVVRRRGVDSSGFLWFRTRARESHHEGAALRRFLFFAELDPRVFPQAACVGSLGTCAGTTRPDGDHWPRRMKQPPGRKKFRNGHSLQVGPGAGVHSSARAAKRSYPRATLRRRCRSCGSRARRAIARVSTARSRQRFGCRTKSWSAISFVLSRRASKREG